MKTHWKKLTNPDYIGAYSLPDGKDLTVKITEVKRELITGTGGKKEECTVAYLQGQKPMILNNTNCKIIQKIYDTPFIEEWKNKAITIYVAKIKAFGEDNVECLRIRPTQPKKPELTATHAKFEDIKKALKDKTYTIEQFKAKYEISNEIEKQLLS